NQRTILPGNYFSQKTNFLETECTDAGTQEVLGVKASNLYHYIGPEEGAYHAANVGKAGHEQNTHEAVFGHFLEGFYPCKGFDVVSSRISLFCFYQTCKPACSHHGIQRGQPGNRKGSKNRIGMSSGQQG